MRSPVITPPRLEETLLPRLRDVYKNDDIVFGSLRARSNPAKECVLVAEPQGMSTPVSQYVRARVSVIVRRSDGSGDFIAAQHLASDIIRKLTSADLPSPVVSMSLDSGPMRQVDDKLIFVYATLLAQVLTI
jgi:hypothetical protein